jgi:hypothetical protein
LTDAAVEAETATLASEAAVSAFLSLRLSETKTEKLSRP